MDSGKLSDFFDDLCLEVGVLLSNYLACVFAFNGGSPCLNRLRVGNDDTDATALERVTIDEGLRDEA